jgi:hypothetical protein
MSILYARQNDKQITTPVIITGVQEEKVSIHEGEITGLVAKSCTHFLGTIYIYIFFLCSAVDGTQALHMLGKHSTTELHLQTSFLSF